MYGVRERKRADSRSATIDAAYALFLQRGYDAVTVADICAPAEIARGTFLRYFASKPAVLDEPMYAMTLWGSATIAAAPDTEGDGAVVRRALTESARYAMEHRAG